MKGRKPRQLCNAALLGCFLLSGCGFSETDRRRDRDENAANPGGLIPNRAGLSRSVVQSNANSFAASVADEGRAAEIGRDILADGGNATDAAVAMYFALAVTLPSAASLGASGACIVHDDKTKNAESFVFAPIAAAGPMRGAAFSVPNGVRGITLMHVRHGSARWEQLVAPAERLARLGMPVSRALSRDVMAGGGTLQDDARRLFGSATEGNTLVQPELAGVLASIRQRGGGEFFQGGLARTISEQISAAGGSMPVEALRNAVPQAGPPASESHYRRRVYVAPGPMAGGAALAGWNGSAPTGPTPTDSGGFAGVAAVDAKGGAAACAMSMGQLFGARVVVPGTGILLGAPTPAAASASPLIIANPGNGEFTFAGAGGGATTAAQAIGYAARLTVENDRPLGAAMGQMQGRGGFVNAIVCPSGLRGSAATCRAAADPTGAGHAVIAAGQ